MHEKTKKEHHNPKKEKKVKFFCLWTFEILHNVECHHGEHTIERPGMDKFNEI
jgi:hypothetical protein